jgi:hypothetical protein
MSTTLAGQIGKIYVTLIVRICHRLDGLYESMEWRNGDMILSSEGIIEQDDGAIMRPIKAPSSDTIARCIHKRGAPKR